MRIVGGQVLYDGALIEADLTVDEDSGLIAAAGNGRVIDARGLHVLPGIVDIHGDAFERQIMPRPGVGFPLDVALKDSDRQCISNGITTVF
ncbi:MAG: alpha-D-ribose 1-methylphosphonate 5-triphosphate diphosphatase, partial [Pseudolabrys sp.]